MLRQINRKGKEKSVTFKDVPDVQIMGDQYGGAGGVGSGRPGVQNVNTGSAGSGVGNMFNMPDEELNNFDRGDGNNRDRASTMDLKSNQGGR